MVNKTMALGRRLDGYADLPNLSRMLQGRSAYVYDVSNLRAAGDPANPSSAPLSREAHNRAMLVYGIASLGGLAVGGGLGWALFSYMFGGSDD